MKDAPTLGHGDVLTTIGAGGSSSGADAKIGSSSGADLKVGTTIGRYVIVSRVGAGAMGVVYAAYDPELDRKLALKLLRPDRRKGAKAEESRARIAREAQAMARLTHPNVAAVHDVGSFEDGVFIAMEFIDGSTLTEWLARPHSRAAALDMFVAAGRGLAAAHAAGIVHRDFKPDNVMIGSDGRPRVMDFGLARSFEEVDPPESLIDTGSSLAAMLSLGDVQLTQTGALLGTPAYMAPEQHLHGAIDQRSDQFSYCVALYEAVCGQRPFRGENLATLSLQISEGRIQEPPRQAKMQRWLRRLLWRGLSADPTRRFPEMSALLVDLERDRRGARRWLPWGAFALAGVGTAALLFSRGDDSNVCAGATAHLEGVWDEARRREVDAALAATGVGFAAETFDRVAQRLDAHAATWVSAREQACLTHQRGESSDTLLDREMHCLDERLAETRALVDVLARADADLVPRAVDAVARLTRIEVCQDAHALLARVPPPEDPVVAARVQELDTRMVEVLALDRAGRYAEALSRALPLLREAEEVGHRPLTAHVRRQVAGLQAEVGEIEPAERQLMQGYWDAIAGGDDAGASAAAALLTSLYSDELAHYDDALLWGEHSRAFLDRLGGDPEGELLMRMALGNAHFSKGDLERAREEYQLSLEVTRATRGPDDPKVGALLNNLGNVEEVSGRLENAERLHREAVEIKERALGPSHPDVAISVHNLANLAYKRGEWDIALEHHLRALAIRENAFGADHMDVGASLSGLGVVYAKIGRKDEALEVQRRALAIFETVHGPMHPSVGVALTNIGDLLIERRRPAEALDAQSRALAIFEASLGPTHHHLSYPLHGMGAALLALGRPQEAVPYLERAVALRAADPSSQPAERAQTGFDLARALWDAQQDRSRAVELAQQARASLAGQPGKEAELEREINAWLHER